MQEKYAALQAQIEPSRIFDDSSRGQATEVTSHPRSTGERIVGRFLRTFVSSHRSFPHQLPVCFSRSRASFTGVQPRT